jgi:hypothetical protein
MRVLPILLILICSGAAAESASELLPLLSDDDFEIREAATERMGNLPGEYLPILKTLSAEAPDPETRCRLRRVIRLVWERKVFAQTRRYLLLHGTAGFQYEFYYAIDIDPNGGFRSGTALKVTSVDADALKQLLTIGDIVSLIDGHSVDSFAGGEPRYGFFAPGTRHVLTVQHQVLYADEAKPIGLGVTTRTSIVEVNATQRDPALVDHDAEQELLRAEWYEWAKKP